MKKVIVSFTSWPKRINNVAKVIFSLLNQSVKPDSIELNLSIEEFPNKENDLPNELKIMYENKLFIINWVDKNTKSFKKLFPTLKKYYGDDYYILTIDFCNIMLYNISIINRKELTIMFISKELRINELKIRIEKLSNNPISNINLIKKAKRKLRKLMS